LQLQKNCKITNNRKYICIYCS